MTLPNGNNFPPISLSDINAEFGLGTNLGAYRGVTWWLDNAGTGTFPTTNLGLADFYSKRSTSPVTPGAQGFTASSSTQNFTVPLYSYMTVILVGGAGGGAGGDSNYDTSAAGANGTASTFGVSGNSFFGSGDYGRGGLKKANGAQNTSGSNTGTVPTRSVTVSNGSNATVTLSNHGLSIGNSFRFGGTTVPGGTSSSTTYYAKSPAFTSSSFRFTDNPSFVDDPFNLFSFTTSSTGTNVTLSVYKTAGGGGGAAGIAGYAAGGNGGDGGITVLTLTNPVVSGGNGPAVGSTVSILAGLGGGGGAGSGGFINGSAANGGNGGGGQNGFVSIYWS